MLPSIRGLQKSDDINNVVVLLGLFNKKGAYQCEVDEGKLSLEANLLSFKKLTFRELGPTKLLTVVNLPLHVNCNNSTLIRN